jgi:hypothetical protein
LHQGGNSRYRILRLPMDNSALLYSVGKSGDNGRSLPIQTKRTSNV